ncbi:hypothetical protein QWY82_14370 [Simiduia curdlanivorans]|uniref:Oligosaccharide repeat unit polymerase n=1 Tax=Simiduia curdlanivorans TaxID=1492769 RepID=A0ABV8V204_9GAMM|nr:hypothetical protein [Simiduia curdlanivorans]MDN3639984.1 hypothetical protein [Simiduia curdlanivorans]
MIIVAFITFLVFYFLMFKGTIFSLSFKNKTFGGFLLAREIFLFVILGAILFNLMGPDATNMYFFITDESIKRTEIFIFYSLFVFVFVVGFISKTFLKNFFMIKKLQGGESNCKGSQVLLDSVLFTLLFLFCVFYLFGMRHAFIGSIVFGGDLMEYRLHNSYGTVTPTVLMSFYDFLVKLFAISIGVSSIYFRKFINFIYLAFLIVFSSFMGGKAPVVSALILFSLGFLSVSKLSMVRASTYFAFSSLILSFGLYFVVKIQMPHLDFFGFIRFLFLRLGTGQIQGVYEQFSVVIQDINYIWHSVPFANFLMDYPIFNKDLMMATYGASLKDEAATGVMNSFFIGEALAIGGVGLVIFSPFIVAFNYLLVYVMCFFIFDKFFKIQRGRARLYIQLLVPSFVVMTGDIAGYLFFKHMVMILFFMLGLWCMRVTVKSLLPRKFVYRAIL